MMKMQILSLDYKTYFNKVYGGWIGKCIGGAIGARVEGQKVLHDFNEENVFPKEWPPNDDLDLQVLWLYVLKNKGIYITSRDLADAWHKYSWYYFNEYGRFLKNYDRGIYPPTSGWFDNNFFRESMGSPIRSEIWGFISPGNPELAARYAEKDAVLDHWKNSVWAEQFFAAIESSLFFTDDIEELIKIGLRYVPEDSKLFNVINLVLEAKRKDLSWVKTRELILRYFGHPDFTSVFQNIGFTLLALLWGEYDFGKTMLIAINSGYDTDCTCATAGAILGGILGADRIPEKWKKPIGNKFIMGFKIPWENYSISYLAEETCKIGILVSKFLNNRVKITGIPSGFIDYQDVNDHKGIDVNINYYGMPTIHIGEVRRIGILIKNNGNSVLEGKLRIKCPKDFECIDHSYDVRIGPRESKEYIFSIRFNGNILLDKNIFVVSLEGKKELIIEERFGLSGAKVWYVKGPFWNSINWITDKADVSEKYIEEEYFEKGRYDKVFQDSLMIFSDESLIDLDKVLPLYGEYCIYLYSRIFSPEEQDADLVIGASGDIKIWFNEELKGSYSGSYIWNPIMYFIPVHLKKGVNNIVIKYVKKCSKSVLSVDFHKPNKEKIPGRSIWLTNLGTVIG